MKELCLQGEKSKETDGRTDRLYVKIVTFFHLEYRH